MATMTQTQVRRTLQGNLPPEGTAIALETLQSPYPRQQQHPPEPQVQIPAESKASWNYPAKNRARVLATFYCFIVLGANDSAYGALIPYLESYYGITHLTVSLIFLSPVVGFVASGLTNNMIHRRFGQRGIVILGSISHITGYLLISRHPPFPALVVVYIFAGFASGLKQAAWNSFIGGLKNHNELLGLLHGFYGLGATISPITATTLITKNRWMWYQFYYLMLGAVVIDGCASLIAFWAETGAAYRETDNLHSRNGAENQGSTAGEQSLENGATSIHVSRGSATVRTLKNKATWQCSLFLLTYVGIEVALGGWIVSFMLDVRKGSSIASGWTATGFWAGLTVGRMVLGFVTAHILKSTKYAIATYMVTVMAFELLFWLVPNFYASAVMVAFLGFFLGPMFPAIVVCLSRLLPKNLHVAAIGFCSAFGSSGACIVPFMIGAVASAKGVAVLQPIILSLLVVCLGIWFWIPRLPKVE